jgi:cardiolipin synthase
MGAIAVAQRSIRICSPYFLPDLPLTSALAIAAQRGVEVDIVIPSQNNLALVDAAMTAQLDQVLRPGCRVWRATGPFDHSKLMAVDGAWALIGSSNLDSRSLRLNFELDVEIYDRDVAGEVDAAIRQRMASAWPETLATLRARPFLTRLRNRTVWLASPYL